MSDVSRQSDYAANLVGGLADAGVDAAFISPGSRNTPLTLATANEPRIQDISVRDERSACFAALGYAKATGRPAIVVCTSGSAAAHYLPAIVEANQSTTPLVVLTADRPLRLRGTSAPQTMDQAHLYGSHAKTFVDLDSEDPSAARDAAITLVRTAMTTPPGVAHANIPFDEPLVPVVAVPHAPPNPVDIETELPPTTTHDDVAQRLESRNVMIVVGGPGRASLADLVCDAAERLGAPVFADPQSNVSGPHVLLHADLVVSPQDAHGQSNALASNPPDVVLRLGAIPTSKPMWTWLRDSGVEQILVKASRLDDPLDSATVTIEQDPVGWLRALQLRQNPNRGFLETWQSMDQTVGKTFEDALSALPFPNEPAIARIIAESAPQGTTLVVGSSRPIRDLDAFGVARTDVTVIANRGVNGIDGAISTAMGIALTGAGTTLYIGDVTALHDVSALSEVAKLGVPLRIVVVNNDGGGIFSMLPQARSDVVPEDVYERHWGTPHGLQIAAIARSMGLAARVITKATALSDVLSSHIVTPELIEILTDRSTNVAHHRTVRAAAHDALRQA